MIIQGGFDLSTLAQPLIVRKSKPNGRLVVIQADESLELVSVTCIAKHFNGSLSPFMDDIIRSLNSEYTKYFAVAHRGSLGQWGEPDEEICDESKVLKGLASEHGIQIIGHILFDSDGWSSIYGSHYFEQYMGDFESLPRTMNHWTRQVNQAGSDDVAPS